MALYERLSQAVPDGALVSFSADYDATRFAAGTAETIFEAPWAGRIVHAQCVVTATIDTTSDITIEIDGGAALDTLASGTAVATADTYTPTDEGDAIAAGEVVTATSDAAAASGTVRVTVVMQKGS